MSIFKTGDFYVWKKGGGQRGLKIGKGDILTNYKKKAEDSHPWKCDLLKRKKKRGGLKTLIIHKKKKRNYALQNTVNRHSHNRHDALIELTGII